MFYLFEEAIHVGPNASESSLNVKKIITPLYKDGMTTTKIGQVSEIPRTTVLSFLQRFLQKRIVKNKERSRRQKLATH